MPDMLNEIVTHPGAWTPAGIGGKQGFERKLDAAELAAIERLLAGVQDKAPLAATRADWDDPAFNALLTSMRETIMNGRGVVIVTGIDRAKYSYEDLQRVYWGFGLHLGVAVEQSQKGDRMGHVRKEPDDPLARGYRGDQELVMHTDSYEHNSLFCLEQAESGGLSGLASSFTVHNEILRTRPGLLLDLYEGFHFAIDELKFSSRPITAAKIPIFGYVDGKLSCMYAEKLTRNGAKQMGVPLPGKLDEALRYFSEIAARPDICAYFMLEPGDMAFWHNFTNLHSRTAFTDSERRKRLLLRLWMEVPGGRPVVPNMRERANAYRWIYQEAKRQNRELTGPAAVS